jgi:hypothetical protein
MATVPAATPVPMTTRWYGFMGRASLGDDGQPCRPA